MPEKMHQLSLTCFTHEDHLCIISINIYIIDIYQEIFTLKIIRIKIFMELNFCGSFHLSTVTTVDGYNMDKRLECS